MLKTKDSFLISLNVMQHLQCKICPNGYTFNLATQMCEKTVVSAPLCPTGYTYDVNTQTCELSTTVPADCTCTVNVVATPTSQNISSGDNTNITLTSSTIGATFSWEVYKAVW